jgi:hypothetical protein
MGVIIREPLELANGMIVNNAYAAIGNSRINITKDTESNQIEIYTFFLVWVDLTARNDGKPPLMEIEVNKKYDTAPVTNIYELLYTGFKTLKNCEDSD